jgi:type I restriction enzyme S subunit
MPSDLRPDGIDFSGAKSTSLHKARQLPQHHLQQGDIVFSRRGDVEKCGLYLAGDPPALCGTGCLRARIDVTKADPVLIYFLAQSDRCGSWLTQHAVGLTMPNLNTSIVGALPIPNLPLVEQKKWVEVLLLSEGACRVNETYVAEAQSLKLALSSDLLSGRVRVPA